MPAYHPRIHVMDHCIEHGVRNMVQHLQRYSSLHLIEDGIEVPVSLTGTEHVSPAARLRLMGYFHDGRAIFAGTFSENGTEEKYIITIERTHGMPDETFRMDVKLLY